MDECNRFTLFSTSAIYKGGGFGYFIWAWGVFFSFTYTLKSADVFGKDNYYLLQHENM